MLGKNSRFAFWTFLVSLTVLQSGTAYAYIDPGAGSMLLQAAVGAVAGGMFFIRMYWARLSGYFKRDAGLNSVSDTASVDAEKSAAE